MAQATQTERASGELLLAGTISGEDFASFIQAYNNIPPDAPALMLLEAQPRRVIEQDARQNLLHFAFFDPSFDFTPYTAGRIFHALGELRWERQHPNVQIVYTGHKEYRPELPDASETRGTSTTRHVRICRLRDSSQCCLSFQGTCTFPK